MFGKERGREFGNLSAGEQAQVNQEMVAQGISLPFTARDNPWWRARDEGLAWWKSQLPEGIRDDPFVEKALAVKEYRELEPELVEWAQRYYDITREEATRDVQRFLKETELQDMINAYRKEVIAADPDFLAAWRAAYEKREIDYLPPKWADEFLEELNELPRASGQ